ncbi:hypothetical protein B0T25DRAFT_565482 [Lasiosphaeria hispida]|uniref:FAD-binding PCMH-type domain-containing protein n=1 Tax=Lasiosphaeria hispida TaxID=260671 RepID=A0AAJ0MIR5_9PEZI|nr:hypothetical protein B0T25DRAFT_565482 [Lasiosphaeria hispida]
MATSNMLFRFSRPDCVVQPQNAAQVQTIIREAKAKPIKVTIKCNGHSYAGHSTTFSGISLDLRGMNKVEARHNGYQAGDVLCDEPVVLALAAVKGDVEARRWRFGGGRRSRSCRWSACWARGRVEGVHGGYDVIGNDALGESFIAAGDDHAVEVAEFLDVEFHLDHDAKVAAAGTAEGPEEAALVRGGWVGLFNGDEGAAGSD